ncbi:ATP-binding protein [Siccirubricoccus sp. KC 17139]|uniref:histidine kinase n=1 Tax=Siccirubricoccus soli TaxID=2899147 RepID=A0ABT1D297_9PROT|nr:ATP-binding protein [Siccirubricoccus soli]MCO6415364.1 ATP-binding protein [Siccirubricoccus soli]MCP2681496.1 ATP-binding protein [Siccirubricoccus soli]
MVTPAPADPQAPLVLVLAPLGRDGPVVAALLRRAGLRAQLCTSLAELVAGLEAGAEVAFVAEEALLGAASAGLEAWVAQQPPWSDMPFVVLTGRDSRSAAAAARECLVRWLGNVSLLERPVQPITLTSAILAAVRARRRQYEVRGYLAERERAAADLEGLVAARTAELEAANRALRTEMAERERAEEALRQAQRIEVLGQLTGGVAHDFNNLLMVIAAGLEMIDRRSDPAQRRRIMDGMRQAAARGAALTRQLLAFSRRQALRAEPVDLVRQVGSMRELLDRSLRGDVEVSLDLAADLWPVEIDPGELELALLNLAVNARDAMPSGGTILIRARNAAGLAEDGLQGDFVRLEVIDSGTGMSPEVQARVFEPFFTTKEVGKGSGLGLAQVYGFARQSGGAVRIDSEVGRGTTITLLLPRAARAPAVPDQKPASGLERPRQPAGHVLLVEDDDEVAALVAQLLGELGFEATRASSAAAALGALANGRAIDLVFSDIMMPGGMNGVELAGEVQRRRPGLPVLLTSGHADAARQHADAVGIAVLPKPYGLSELAAAIRGALKRRPADARALAGRARA